MQRDAYPFFIAYFLHLKNLNLRDIKNLFNCVSPQNDYKYVNYMSFMWNLKPFKTILA